MSEVRKKYNDSWMYILLLSTLLILIEQAKTYNINIFNNNISIVIFLIPFLYAITNYITKIYGFKKGLRAIFTSIVSLLTFTLLMSFALGKDLNLINITGELLAYTISQTANIMIYKFLLVNTNSPYILVLLNYIFAHIVFYAVHTLIKLNTIIAEEFWKPYFIVIIIQVIISIVLAIIDKKIKTGMTKND